VVRVGAVVGLAASTAAFNKGEPESAAGVVGMAGASGASFRPPGSWLKRLAGVVFAAIGLWVLWFGRQVTS